MLHFGYVMAYTFLSCNRAYHDGKMVGSFFVCRKVSLRYIDHPFAFFFFSVKNSISALCSPGASSADCRPVDTVGPSRRHQDSTGICVRFVWIKRRN